MAKQKSKRFALGPFVAIRSHLDKPDTEAPPGASFTPDGKYKVTGVADSMEPFAELEAGIREAAEEKFSGIDWDTFEWPWRVMGEDHDNQDLAGKVLVTAKTKIKPDILGRGNVKLPASVKVYSGDIIKIAAGLYAYERTENVREGKKLVPITVRGCSLQLSMVKLIEKRAGGNPFGDDDADEGYLPVTDDETLYTPDGEAPDVSGNF